MALHHWLRFSLFALLGGLGLAGLINLSLQPPLTSRSGAASELTSGQELADLEAQEALQEARERATITLDRFVGGEITRAFWGGFTQYLDVLGIEPPEDMAARVSGNAEAVELRLTPAEGSERYIARVEAFGGVPRGVACRGVGEPGSFSVQAGKLRCPQGWTPLTGLQKNSR